MVVIAFEAHSNNASGLIHLCYPLSTLEPLFPRLSPNAQRTEIRAQSTDAVAKNRSLSKMQVSATVEIASGTLPLREIAELKAGDVIKLDTQKDDPAVVYLGNQPKFLARPGLDGRRRAAQIISAIDDGEEEQYR